MVYIKVTELLAEAKASPIDLMRGANLSQGTAYRLAHNDAQAITFEVLDSLCFYFSERLSRDVDISDILERAGHRYQPTPAPSA